MIVNPHNPLPTDLASDLANIETDLGPQGNEYLFLRSIWRTHSHQYTHAVVDLDDQLDRLNKIVGMMKKHISYNVKKELYYQNGTAYEEISVREGRMMEAMGKAMLDAEEWRTRLAEKIGQNEELKKINQELKQQILDLKKKRKEDTRTITELKQKNVSLQSKLLASDYQDSKSNSSFLRSSRNFDKDSNNADPLRESLLLNASLSQSIHIPKMAAEKERTRLRSKGRYSNQDQDQEPDDWLNQNSTTQNGNLDQSVLSVSSYGIFPGKVGMNRMASQQENKENFEESRYGHYESQRNLLKEKSLKKNRLKSINRIDLLGESPKQAIKFIRQNSKKTLLRKSQKLSQSTVIQDEIK